MAAPHVAGAWAVMRQAFPDASVTQVLYALERAGPDVTDRRNGVVTPRLAVNSAIANFDFAERPTGEPTPLPDGTTPATDPCEAPGGGFSLLLLILIIVGGIFLISIIGGGIRSLNNRRTA